MLESDSNILGDRYKNCKDANEKIWYEALYAISRGNEVKTIARIIYVDVSALYARHNGIKKDKHACLAPLLTKIPLRT